MNMAFPKIARRFSAGYGWSRESQSRLGRKKDSAVPDGTATAAAAEVPALKRRAVFGFPMRRKPAVGNFDAPSRDEITGLHRGASGLKLDAWSFVGTWNLELGISA
jgi:hypothetical protein